MVTIRRDGQALPPVSVPVGQEQTLQLPIEHGGQTVFEITAEDGPQEITKVNNTAVLSVNGVRDRLKVLLTHEEIAQSMGRTASFSKSQLARGTRRLRELLCIDLKEARHA